LRVKIPFLSILRLPGVSVFSDRLKFRGAPPATTTVVRGRRPEPLWSRCIYELWPALDCPLSCLYLPSPVLVYLILHRCTYLYWLIHGSPSDTLHYPACRWQHHTRAYFTHSPLCHVPTVRPVTGEDRLWVGIRREDVACTCHI